METYIRQLELIYSPLKSARDSKEIGDGSLILEAQSLGRQSTSSSSGGSKDEAKNSPKYRVAPISMRFDKAYHQYLNRNYYSSENKCHSSAKDWKLWTICRAFYPIVQRRDWSNKELKEGNQCADPKAMLSRGFKSRISSVKLGYEDGQKSSESEWMTFKSETCYFDTNSSGRLSQSIISISNECKTYLPVMWKINVNNGQR
ncbi:unnamed protein product [Lepeophtheirus salmonis]|uniref:(salmon louse) hypothetical protein n=1 Tax=Lepeophtheirus salmonis TaxID=72036 RepID=A0A7R8CKZ7_LEPSM|nr:unnamed protein product [Lepeophtheirus salmonis]CAF2852969.1 unnamed protein product [Lepeophtheirus salmonis]